MLTISQAVEKVIKVKPFVTEALCEGLINISSLSRQIHTTIEKLTGKEVKQGAIVMALNRLVPSLKGNGDLTYRNVITSIGDIIVRSDLTDYTFRNSPTIIENHVKLMNQLVGRQDQFCTVVRGVFETTLVVGTEICPLVEVFFAGENCSYKNSSLSAITLKLSTGNVHFVGFYYQILKFIAWEGINVKEVISTANEFTIVVAEEDVDAAFAILKNLKQSGKVVEE